MKKTSVKKYGKPEEKPGPGTYYKDLPGKGKGSRQAHPTHDELLAKARAAQYMGDPNLATPFPMPTNQQPVVYSIGLPRHFTDELNPIRFDMAPLWGNMYEAFGVMFETSTDLWDWLRCNEVSKNVSFYDFARDSNRRYSEKIKEAKRHGNDAKVIKALEFEKMNACGEIVVSALRQVLRDVSAVVGSNDLPLNLTPGDFAARKCRLGAVKDLALQAEKLHWKLQKTNRQSSDQTPEKKKGKNQRQKNHKPGRGKERMVAVKQAIVALATAD